MKEDSIEEVLLGLIEDSDLIEVVCCLDLISRKEGKKIRMFMDEEQVYPVVKTTSTIEPAQACEKNE